ncbi:MULTISPECIES: S49 family peptidase [unclassified Paludibacterium]|uniref:S49 family peptidase n=1 Tax=unclassified Paludibacterium TaxID=2618429 RepID=UPI001C046E55|nr:S49 family peptidase [Paludibacterium sp. B53371]BEV70653.1 S49 family peptidase [Paludibacterium sp. THUN1379]
MSDQNWERTLLEQLASAALIEQRRSRRWKIFFRLAWLAVFAAIAASMLWSNEEKSVSRLTGNGHAAILNLQGEISSENNTADKLIQGLADAYADKGTRGIILQANSPGGSPVLSGMVYDEIRRQKKLHPAIPVVVVVEEMCASGCYYIASAADRIYVDKASIVGSIGVLSDGFGFTGLMDKLGVERRLKTAGENKAMGDPFSPVNPKQEAIRQQLLDDIHAQFIKAVRDGRGQRLKETPDMFSGMVWLGERSIPLGLADAYGTVASVTRNEFKTDQTVDFTPQDDLSSRVARRFGVAFSAGIKSLFDPRLL